MVDDDEKIRRNLVVLSALIISTFWLELPISELLERLFSFKSEPKIRLSEKKLWFAIIFVIFYLSWRYRWSDTVSDGLAAHQERVASKFMELYDSEYLKEVSQWIKAGEAPPGAPPQLKRTVKFVKNTEINNLGGPLRYLGVQRSQKGTPAGDAEMKSGALSGKGIPVTIRIVYEDTSQNKSDQFDEREVMTNIPMGAAARSTLMQKAQLSALLNSKSSMDLTWPIGLAAIAAAVAVFKFASAFAGQ